MLPKGRAYSRRFVRPTLHLTVCQSIGLSKHLGLGGSIL